MGLVSLERRHLEVLFLLGLVTAVEGGTNVLRGGLLFKWPHKNSDPFTMQRLLMKFSWVVSTSIAHVLLIHATGNMEMDLIDKEHECVRRPVFQERFTSCLTSVKITFGELLHHCHFVWMKAKFFVKDSSHNAVRNPQGSCMFGAERLGERSLQVPCVFFFTLPLTLNVFTHKTTDCRPRSGAPVRTLNRVRKAR